MNGMPCGYPLLEDGKWVYLASRGVNPNQMLLEYLWTRLSYNFGVSTKIFGEDLEDDGANPLLLMKYTETNNKKGWAYNYIMLSKERLSKGNETTPWNPVEISETEYTILQRITREGSLSLDDTDLNNYITRQGLCLEEIIATLVSKRLIYKESKTIFFLTDECISVITPDGKLYAGDNKDGKMLRWVKKTNRHIVTSSIHRR